MTSIWLGGYVGYNWTLAFSTGDGAHEFYDRETIAAEGGADPDCATCEGTGHVA